MIVGCLVSATPQLAIIQIRQGWLESCQCAFHAEKMYDTPSLADDFFEPVQRLDTTSQKTRWYMCVIVNLSAMNYPDVVPAVWQHASEHFLSGLTHDEKFEATRKIREGLTKSTGIVGAAKVSRAIFKVNSSHRSCCNKAERSKTGTTMRLLAEHIPAELRDPTPYRQVQHRRMIATPLTVCQSTRRSGEGKGARSCLPQAHLRAESRIRS